MLHAVGLHLQPGLALMIVAHCPPADPPQPLYSIGVRGIGRGVDQVQLALQLGQHLPHQPRAGLSVSTQVIRDYHRHPAAGLRARSCRPPLLATGRRRSAWGQAAVDPAVDPVHNAQAVDRGIGPRSDHQPLAPSPFAAPNSCQRRVEGELHLILEVDISLWQYLKQRGQIRRELVEQVRFSQIGHGWRRSEAGARKEHLHPQAFPT
jgi:hypothetical protein